MTSSNPGSSATELLGKPNILSYDLARPETYSFGRVLVISLLTFGCMLPVTMLVPPLKELVGLRFDAHPFWSHAFMSVNMIGAILAGPLIGRLADGRTPRKTVAAAALAADAILLSLLAIAPNLWLLLALRLFEGAAHILALSTLMGLASRWSDPARRGRSMGIVGAFMMFGTACGTRLGGVVWHEWPGWTFYVAGIIAAIVAFATLLAAGEPESAGQTEKRSGIAGLVRERPSLLLAYAYAFIDRFCVGVVITTFGLFLADAHQLDPDARSKMLVMFLLPFAALIYPAGLLVDRIGRVWTISLGNIGFGLVFACYGLVTIEQLRMLMLASGLLSAIMFAPNLTLCADLVPVHRRGTAFTGFNIAGSVGFLIGPLAAGAFYSSVAAFASSNTAYQATFIFAGSMVVLCGLGTLPPLLRLKRAGVTR